MECRLSPRQKRLIPCDLEQAGARVPGEVLDVSATGLFVRTSAECGVGTEVGVHLAKGAGRPAMSLLCAVVRLKMDDDVAQVVVPGLGLRVITAPEAWRRLVDAGPDTAPAPPAVAVEPDDPDEDEVPTLRCVSEIHIEEGEPLPMFRVRVTHSDQGRYRTLTVEAKSERDAEGAALALAGPGWEAVDVDSITLQR